MISKEEFIQRCNAAQDATVAENRRLNDSMTELRALCVLGGYRLTVLKDHVQVDDEGGHPVCSGSRAEVIRLLVDPA